MRLPIFEVEYVMARIEHNISKAYEERYPIPTLPACLEMHLTQLSFSTLLLVFGRRILKLRLQPCFVLSDEFSRLETARDCYLSLAKRKFLSTE
jgi:hypothetical protein